MKSPRKPEVLGTHRAQGAAAACINACVLGDQREAEASC